MSATSLPGKDTLLALPPSERQRLAEQLLDSLQDSSGRPESRAWLVETERECPAPLAPREPTMLMFGLPMVLEFGWMAFKFIGNRAAGAMVGKAADIGFGHLLKLFGYDSPTDRILDKLREIDGKLDHVADLVQALSKQTAELFGALDIAADKIISEANALELKRSVDVITNTFNALTTGFAGRAPGAHTKAGRDEATRFARAILSPKGHNIDQMLWNVHSSVIGASPGTTGALDAMTNLLIDQTDAGHDLYDCYRALEHYFGELLTIQAKGLLLMIEALNHAAPLPTALTGPPAADDAAPAQPSAAQDYADRKFRPNIEQQVDQFLTCVDRLIVHQANVRSELARPAPFFAHPDKVERVYAQADCLAAQVAPARHPAGLVARLVGEPGNIEAALQARAVTSGGTPVGRGAVAGQDIRHYAPVWPAHFKVHQYLEWQWVPDAHVQRDGVALFIPDDHRRFVPATTIAVLKLALDAPALGDDRCGTVQVVHEAGQEAELAFWDETGQRHPARTGDSDMLYGHVCFPIRHLPSLRDLGSAVEVNWTGWALQAERDVAHTTLRLGATLVPQKCGVSYAAAQHGGFHWLVVNGSKLPLSLDQRWAVSGAFQNNIHGEMIWWTDGGVAGNGSVHVQALAPAGLPSFTATGALPSAKEWNPCAEQLAFPPGCEVSIDLVATLRTGTFTYRHSPTFSKFRVKCRLPAVVSASATAELKSFELTLR